VALLAAGPPKTWVCACAMPHKSIKKPQTSKARNCLAIWKKGKAQFECMNKIF
jgi:hypothetical protein